MWSKRFSQSRTTETLAPTSRGPSSSWTCSAYRSSAGQRTGCSRDAPTSPERPRRHGARRGCLRTHGRSVDPRPPRRSLFRSIPHATCQSAISMLAASETLQPCHLPLLLRLGLLALLGLGGNSLYAREHRRGALCRERVALVRQDRFFCTHWRPGLFENVGIASRLVTRASHQLLFADSR